MGCAMRCVSSSWASSNLVEGGEGEHKGRVNGKVCASAMMPQI